MFFCGNLFHVSCPPCLPHTEEILMAKNTWSPYLEGWGRGRGKPWVFLSGDPISWNKGGWVMLQVVAGNISSPPILYSHRYQAAICLQLNHRNSWIHFLNKSLKVGVCLSLIKWFLVFSAAITTLEFTSFIKVQRLESSYLWSNVSLSKRTILNPVRLKRAVRLNMTTCPWQRSA